MSSVAKCHCGDVIITCDAEADPVIVCHCELCQRRTGSFFGVTAWFERTAVTIEGETTEFRRTTGDAGLEFSFNFCAKCGTSIWWSPARADGPLKGKIGIAGGCFGAEKLPCPKLSIYEKRMHSWVTPPEDVAHYEAGI